MNHHQPQTVVNWKNILGISGKSPCIFQIYKPSTRLLIHQSTQPRISQTCRSKKMINRRIVTGWIPEMEAVAHLLRNHVLLRNQGDVKALKHISTNFFSSHSCQGFSVWQNHYDCCIVNQCGVIASLYIPENSPAAWPVFPNHQFVSFHNPWMTILDMGDWSSKVQTIQGLIRTLLPFNQTWKGSIDI